MIRYCKNAFCSIAVLAVVALVYKILVSPVFSYCMDLIGVMKLVFQCLMQLAGSRKMGPGVEKLGSEVLIGTRGSCVCHAGLPHGARHRPDA